MSIVPVFPVRMGAGNLALVSRDLLDVDAADIVQDVDSGLLFDPSGLTGVYTRGATLASVVDANGITYTAQPGQIAYEQRDWDNDGTREALVVRMGASDRIVYATALAPHGMHGLLEFVETGARITANATLFALQATAGTGAGVWIDTSGTFYRMSYSDGATTRTATLAAGQPAVNDRVRMVWDLTDTGVLTFRQSINGGAFTQASAAALALPTGAVWAATAAWRINRRGDTANPAQMAFRRARVRSGPLDLDRLVERR